MYGSLGAAGKFSEIVAALPSSPYSASKAAADLLALAYGQTFGMDVVVTRCSNNYGPYQFPEKLIPLMIANALEGKKLPVYGDGLQVRDWIHVEDHCRALLAALSDGPPGGGLQPGLRQRVAQPPHRRAPARDPRQGQRSSIEHVKDRPGHDRRYAIDASKARAELGWAPRVGFEEGLEATVRWYVQHRDWWERIRTGAYRTYYERNYGGR